ncbi:hypothetical protein CR513_42108, partial [Mucuna pruriens]
MLRFLHGLDREIQDIVELHHYSTIKDLGHQANKVKSQLRRKFFSRKSNSNASWKDKEKEREMLRKDKMFNSESSAQKDTSSSSGGESLSEESHY